MQRKDLRAKNALRKTNIVSGYVSTAWGSCLMETGGTRVICTASVEKGVPPFLKGTGEGWLTAEYAMLPASTGQRKRRDGVKRDSRGVEISRLIGRALRAAVDMSRLGENTITIDCDVLEADGGTRTAAITGGFVALCLAVDRMLAEGLIRESPIVHQVAAVSAGIVEDVPCLDLCYQEDSLAQVDMNFVMDEKGSFIELQGTGEGRAFTGEELGALVQLASEGIAQLMAKQRQALGDRQAVIDPRRILVIASNNPHKIGELKAMLGERYTILGMAEAGFSGDMEETGETFFENAVIKAEAVSAATGYLALADDSGLQVDALDGAPGVHSARYAGQHGDDKANNDLLISNLKHVNREDRTAQFVSVLALSRPNGKTYTFEGVCPGVITLAPRGTAGFGYDPYFEFSSGKTFAQMSQEEKSVFSHRARAMQKLQAFLNETAQL